MAVSLVRSTARNFISLSFPPHPLPVQADILFPLPRDFHTMVHGYGHTSTDIRDSPELC